MLHVSASQDHLQAIHSFKEPTTPSKSLSLILMLQDVFLLVNREILKLVKNDKGEHTHAHTLTYIHTRARNS
jgi:hypothetical protein